MVLTIWFQFLLRSNLPFQYQEYEMEVTTVM